MRFASLTTLASCSLVMLMAACSSAPTAPVKATAPAAETSQSASAGQAAPTGAHGGAAQGSALGGQGAAGAGASAQTAAFDPRAQSVFFAFDDATVASGNQALFQSEWRWLQDHPQQVLTLQGNTDERGGSEYNLALGQRRAEAVKKALTLLGAAPERLDTVSFGKEKPRATCHDEACWKDNRRVDFAPAAR